MQKHLPNWLIDRIGEYEKIESIPQAFTDSTHQLWSLQGSSLDQKNHFLKVCSHTESPFWEITQALFGFELRLEISNFSENYDFINRTTSLKVPELIKAETLKDGHAYMLTSELNGKLVDITTNDVMVRQLAKHLAELHSNSNATWGALNNPIFNASDWPIRVEAILRKSASKWGGVIEYTDKYLEQALEACTSIKTTTFVSMMPDLRWDQFFQADGTLSALVDLDAFVYAPRELDFVILEYILSADQIGVFSDEYSKHHAFIDITEVRPVYRLLLFYMQILGETDLENWMQKKEFF